MKIFVYGPLSFIDVCEAVLSKMPPHETAILHDFAYAQSTRTGNYGVFPQPGGQVEGLVLENLESRDLRFLNIFFDSYYEIRRLDSLQTPRHEPIGNAYAWIVPSRYKEVVQEKEFISHVFDLHFKQDFIKASKEYRREVMLNGYRNAFTFGADIKGF